MFYIHLGLGDDLMGNNYCHSGRHLLMAYSKNDVTDKVPMSYQHSRLIALGTGLAEPRGHN